MEKVTFGPFKGWSPLNRPPSTLNPSEVGEGHLVDANGIEVLPSGRARWRRNQFRLASPRVTSVSGAIEVYGGGDTDLCGVYHISGTHNGKNMYVQQRSDLVYADGAPKLWYDGAKWVLLNAIETITYYTGGATLTGTWVVTSGTEPTITVVAADYSGDITGLYELRTNDQSRILCLKGGRLYAMDAYWTHSPTQWDYGYQYFSSENSWYMLGLLNADTMSCVSGARVIFCHQGSAVQMYNGDWMREVGVPAPVSAPVVVPPGGVANEGLAATWTNHSGGVVTTTATTATAVNLTGASNSRVYRDMTLDAITDFEYRFTFTPQVSDAGSVAVIWASCNTDDAKVTSWVGDYISIYANSDVDVMHVGIEVITGASQFISGTGLAYGVAVYVTVSRSGADTTLSIYSDSARTTLLWSVSTGAINSTPYQYNYIMVSTDAGSYKFNAIVDGLNLGHKAYNAGILPKGNYWYYYTYVCNGSESMPSPAMNALLLSDGFRVELASITPGPIGTTERRLYRNYSSDTTVGAIGSEYVFLQKVDGNITLIATDNSSENGLGEPIGYDHAIPPRGGVCTYHMNRVWIAGSEEASRSYPDYTTGDYASCVFYSEPDTLYFPGLNFINVGDAAPIVNMVSSGEELLIFKTNSVWALSGYSEGTYQLTCISAEVGAVDGNAAASSPHGTMWASPGGYYMYSGGQVFQVLPVGEGWPWAATSNTHAPHICFHDDRFYIQQTDVVLTYNPLSRFWGYSSSVIGGAGLSQQGYGLLQGHILCTMPWVASGDKEITILDMLGAPATRDAVGTSSTLMFAPVALTFGPVDAPLGEELIPCEVWMDGNWTTDLTNPLSLYVNDDAGYTGTAWATVPSCPQGNNCIGVPHGNGTDSNASRRLYVQVKSANAVDLDIRQVILKFRRRKARGA